MQQPQSEHKGRIQKKAITGESYQKLKKGQGELHLHRRILSSLYSKPDSDQIHLSINYFYNLVNSKFEEAN